MKSEKNIDETLKVYREAHASVARYTLKIYDGNRRTETITKTGLPFDVAMREADEFNRKHKKGFRSDLCIPIIENSEEARAAVRVAAEAYWSESVA